MIGVGGGRHGELQVRGAIRSCREDDVSLSCLAASSPGAVGDPQVVPGWVEDPEVGQAPWPGLEVLTKRPPRRDNPVAFSTDIVHLKHELDPGWRQPHGTGTRSFAPEGSDAHAASLQRDLRARLVAPVGGKAETQDARVEVNGDVQIVREDLEPRSHLHHSILADDCLASPATTQARS